MDTQKTRTRNPTQTRSRLLQATVKILAQKGADALSLKEAAQLAQVSRGAAYQHFEDRDHLLREAKGWITERVVESLRDRGPGDTDDLLLHTARLILENRDAAALLVADAVAGRDLSMDHPLTRMMRESLERLKSSGSARADLDIDILSYIFLGTVSTLVMLSRLPGTNTEELAQRFAREFSGFMRLGIFEPSSTQLPPRP